MMPEYLANIPLERSQLFYNYIYPIWIYFEKKSNFQFLFLYSSKFLQLYTHLHSNSTIGTGLIVHLLNHLYKTILLQTRQ